MSSEQTHTVFNQVPDLAGYNLFTSDPTLQRALAQYGARWHEEALVRYGAKLGEAQTLELGALANKFPPTLATHSRTGVRVDRVDFHPSWHALLALLRSEGLHALPFSHPRAGAWAARTAGYFLQAQVESGSLCPTTMTFASIRCCAPSPRSSRPSAPSSTAACTTRETCPGARNSP